MVYTENHDQNAWDGTEFERFGKALPDAITLSFVGEGIPLIYNGQEAGNPKRLKFFERDPIEWRDHPNADLFKRLTAFRKAHPALWNAPWGAAMTPVVNRVPSKVLSFVREKNGDKIFALFNLSGEPQTVGFIDGPSDGEYIDFANGAAVTVNRSSRIALAPWSYRIFTGARR